MIASDLTKQITKLPYSLYTRPRFFQKIAEDDKNLFGLKNIDLANTGFTMVAAVKDKTKVYDDFIKYKQNIIKHSNDMMRGVPDSENLMVTSPFLLGFEV